LLQVIVPSDGSTDKTNAIVKEYGEHEVQLLELPGRQGKENAQKSYPVLPILP
jgi:glycosyltransferase involved in cell wall biosynthesis